MMDKKLKKTYSKQEAIPKIERYCVYQERCHKEVSQKLYDMGLRSDEVMEVLNEMVKRGFLNEERFAKAFAGGKFRQKGWGKSKIIRELKARAISDYCIQSALKEIGDDDYAGTIDKLAQKYIRLHRNLKPWELKQKTLRHLISKGYDYDQCHEILNRLIEP
ncbi:MAG: RecX family transcriptional regulator [Bacteroidetes bacterium]|nr:RecX family transcriptional regulator [Bacteroidota bacterium]